MPVRILLRLDAIQRRLLLLSGLISMALPTAQRLLSSELFDARQYYVFLGIAGPFEVLELPRLDGPGKLGEPRSQFRPGEWFGFKSNLTVEAGVGLTGARIIVRMADGVEVWREEMRLPPGERRQGEAIYFQHLPKDLRPGPYQLRLRATFSPPGRPPVTADDFPTLSFEVLSP